MGNLLKIANEAVHMYVKDILGGCDVYGFLTKDMIENCF